jgi:hypothetical protein
MSTPRDREPPEVLLRSTHRIHVRTGHYGEDRVTLSGVV